MNAAPISLTSLSAQEQFIDLGAGLHGVLRTEGGTRELYVRNDSDEVQSFRPAAHLGGPAAPRFLAGEVTTGGDTGDELVCLLAPRAFVRLAGSDTESL